MKHSFQSQFLLLVLVFSTFTAHAQTEAEAETSQFRFPLDEGNTWVYRTYDYPLCFLSVGCYQYRLSIVERPIPSADCGTIRSVKSRLLHDDNYRITGLSVESVSDFTLCQAGNRIYQYRDLNEVPTVIEERDMIADFDRATDQPWIIEYNPDFNPEARYLLRRRIFEVPPPVGPYGQTDFAFVTYWAENAQVLEPDDWYYNARLESFTSGIGFPTYASGLLLGYYVNGQVTGDTTTVWATSIDRHPEDRIDEGPALTSVYPNPFNPMTTVRWYAGTLDHPSPVRVFVVDLLGREVAVLFDGMQAPGAYSATFDAAYLPSGAYVVVLRAGYTTDRRMVTLVK